MPPMILALLCLLSLQSPWPGFRGPERCGRAPAVQLPASFEPDRDRLWRTELEPGHSSPVLAGDGVFVTFNRGGRVHAACFDAKGGQKRWERRSPQPLDGDGGQIKLEPPLLAASTPVTDGEGLFVWYPDFGLVGYELDGEERWRRPLIRFYAPYPGASSPALAKGRLIHLHDHDRQSFLIALDPADGSVLWKTERPFATHGFSSPTIVGNTVIASGSHRVDAYDLETGRSSWWAEGMAWQARATPVVGNGVVYVQSMVKTVSDLGLRVVSESWPEALREWDADGDGRLVPAEIENADVPGQWSLHDLNDDGALELEEWERLRSRARSGSGLWALRLGGAGSVGGSHVLWTRDRRVPLNATPLLLGTLLVAVRDGGHVVALDARNGEERWTTSVKGMRADVYVSPIAIGGQVVVIGENGLLAILDPRSGRVSSRHELREDVWATPAVGREAFYVRTSEALHAFRLGGTPPVSDARAFVGVDVLPIDGRGRQRDQTIVIRGGRVVRIGPSRSTPLPPGARVLASGPDLTVVPGLIDMWARVEDEHELIRHLAAGVTTLRIVDGRPALLAVRERVLRGELPGPELLIGAPALLARFTPEEAVAAVEAGAAAGYDFVSADRDLSAEVWLAAAARARELGIPFAGVRPRGLDLGVALANAPWTIDHLETLVGEPDLVEHLAGAEIAVTPLVASFATWITASSQRGKWILDELALRDVSPILRTLWSPSAHALQRGLPYGELKRHSRSSQAQCAALPVLDAAGVPLLAGSDAIACFVHPGQGLHRELAAFVEAGLSTERALRAATVTPGRVLAPLLGEARGRVELGGVADLILVEGDPLADPRVLERPLGTMVAGRWYRRGELEAALGAARETYRREAAFVEAVAVRRPHGPTLAEVLAGAELRELDLRESTVHRMAQLLLHPGIARVEDAATLHEFASRRWPVEPASDSTAERPR